MCRSVAFFLIVLFAISETAAPAQAAQASRTTARLVATARLWGAIKYFDPDVAGHPDVDWDNALVDALPLIESARTRTEYAAAIERMLSTLHDPSTRVLSGSSSATAKGPAFMTSVQNGVAILRVNDLPALVTDSGATVDTFLKSALTARGIVLDLRAARALTDDEIDGLANSLLPDSIISLVSGTVPLLDSRSPFYQGFPPSTYYSDDYYAGFETKTGGLMVGKAGRSLPMSLLVNKNSEIPSALLALIRAGRVHVIEDGSQPTPPVSVATIVHLSDGVSVQVRSADFVDGAFLLKSNVTSIPEGSAPSNALAAAIAALSMPLLPPSQSSASPAPSPVATATDQDYASTTMPSEPYRLLAAFKIYNVIRYFFPYRALMHDDWDIALGEAIPELRRASSSFPYYLALAKFYAHVHDSHGVIFGPYHDKYFGACPPFVVRYLHGVPVIVDFTNRDAGLHGGAQIGDVILAIDGKSVPTVIKRWLPYINASTPQWGLPLVFVRALYGEDGSRLSLVVRTPEGRIGNLRFTRSTNFTNAVHRTGSVYRILSGNVGYVDLARLTTAQVDNMFSALRNTRAILFDDRGYPNGTAWLIAPRLTTQDRVKTALFETPLSREMVPEEDAAVYHPTMSSVYGLLPSAQSKSRYLRSTALLIDERTISQAEYTGMMLRAADNTRFVGTPTAGADGDITTFTVPGDLTLWFTGLSVRWPDGRQTQRVGLHPDVRVEPTAADIALGNDVVLQTGLGEALRRAGVGKAEITKAVRAERKAELSAFREASAARGR